MAVGLRLEVSQTQQLVMTPQLQQAIKLLQMSNVELCEFVASEVEANPLLVLEQTSERPSPEPASADPPELDKKVTTEGDMNLPGETFDTGRENIHDDTPSEAPEPMSDGWSSVGAAGPSGFDGDLPDLDARLAEQTTLRDHLLKQLGAMRGAADDLAVAAAIVEELDENGYFRTDINSFSERLGILPDQGERALTLLQSCDPTGIAATSLAECFELQLVERNRLDPMMANLLQDLEQITRMSPRALAQRHGITDEDLADMLSELRSLTPYPADSFVTDRPESRIPDVFVKRSPWGGWQVELNSETLPRVLLDRRYASELSESGDEVKSYLSQCRNTAHWLVKSLDQRARTIMRVAGEIVRQQESFFNEGISGLQPLTLKVVADALDIHESTASRVTTNKYIATERGIFEMKFFFTNAVGAGDGISAESVRHRVKQLIDAEDACAILSDDAIVDILQADGIDIARRTVAKYRKNLKLGSSVERRRQKALLAQ
ncbi:MAG: RNA polymerase factor sigma-54 [Pseudomonadota bacterium]